MSQTRRTVDQVSAFRQTPKPGAPAPDVTGAMNVASEKAALHPSTNEKSMLGAPRPSMKAPGNIWQDNKGQLAAFWGRVKPIAERHGVIGSGEVREWVHEMLNVEHLKEHDGTFDETIEFLESIKDVTVTDKDTAPVAHTAEDWINFAAYIMDTYQGITKANILTILGVAKGSEVTDYDAAERTINDWATEPNNRVEPTDDNTSTDGENGAYNPIAVWPTPNGNVIYKGVIFSVTLYGMGTKAMAVRKMDEFIAMREFINPSCFASKSAALAAAAKTAPAPAPASGTTEARKSKDFTGITRLLNETGGSKFKLATLYNGQPDKNPFEVGKARDIEVLLKMLAAAEIDGLAFDIGTLYQVPGSVSWGTGPEIPGSNGKHWRSDMAFVIKAAQ